MNQYISDAFKKLEGLNEEAFELTNTGMEELKAFEEEPEEDIIEITDLSATTEDELKDSYVGKVVLDCNVCHSKVYKDKEEVKIDEESDLANVGEECEFCFSTDGYKIIGEIKEYCPDCGDSKEEIKVKDTEKVDSDENEEETSFVLKNYQESIKKARAKKLTEGKYPGYRHMTGAQRQNARNARIFDQAEGVHLAQKDFLIKNGVSKEEAEELYKNTGLGKDALGQKLIDLGLKDEFFAKYDFKTGKLSENKSCKEDKTSKRDRIDADRDNRVERIRKVFDRIRDDADSDRDYKLKKAGLNEVFETVDDFKTFGFVDKTAQGYEVKELYQDKRDRRIHVIAYRPKQNDYIVGLGYSLDDGTWNQGRYDFETLDEAIDYLFDNYKVFPYKRKEESLKESDKPAATSIEDAQKWVDYDMKRYGKISDRTNRLVRKAGFQILKDQYGDYEVAAGKFESVRKTNKRRLRESKEDLTLNVKEWYKKEYPTDELGDEIDEKVTFVDIEKKPADVYEILGVKDSVVRERVFDKLAKLLNVDYETIYDRWLEESRCTKKRKNLKESEELRYQVVTYSDDSGEDEKLSYTTYKDAINGAKEFVKDEYYETVAIYDRKNKSFKNLKGLHSFVESLKEDFERVDIETDREKMSMTAEADGKVVVTTEPKREQHEEEVIAPVEEKTKEEIINNSEEDEDSLNIDIDEFDEESFDELGEGYLKKVYDNVDDYKTTKVIEKDNKIMIEGLIKFNSGKTKKTTFIFESDAATPSKKVRFIGQNAEITNGVKAFTLKGTIKNGSLLSESLHYAYTTANNKKVSGRVRKK